MVFQKKSAQGPAAFGNTLQLVDQDPTGGQRTIDSVGGGDSTEPSPREKTGRSRGDVGRGQIGIGRGRGRRQFIREERKDLDVLSARAKWGCAVGSDAVFGPSSTRYFYVPQSFKMAGDDAPFRPRFGAGLGGYWSPFNLLALVDVRITPFVSIPLLEILSIDPTKGVDQAYGGGLTYAFAYEVGTGDSPLRAAGPWAALLPITIEKLPRVATSVSQQWANAKGSTLAIRVNSLNVTARARSTGAMGTNIDTLQDLIEFQEGVYAVWKMRDEIISSLLTKFSNQISGVESLTPVDPMSRTSANLMQLGLWMKGRHGTPGSLDSVSRSYIKASIRTLWGVMFAGEPQAGARINSCVFNEANDGSGGRVSSPAGDLLAAASLKALAEQVPRQADIAPGLPVSSYGEMWKVGGGISELNPSASFRPSLPRNNQTKAWGLYTNLRRALVNAKVKAAIGTGELLAKVFTHALSEESKIAVVKFLTSQHLTTSALASKLIRVKGMTSQSTFTDVESFLNALLILDLGCLDVSSNNLRGAVGQFSMWIPQRAFALRRGEISEWEGVNFPNLFPKFPILFNYVNVLPKFHTLFTNVDGPYMVWSEDTPYVPIPGGGGDVIPIDDEDDEVIVIEDPLEPEPFPREVVEQVMGTPLFTMIADHVGVDLKAQVEVIAGNAHNWGVPAQGVMSYLILASHYNTKPIEEVNSLFTAGFESTLSADESLQQTFQKVGGALQQYQDGTLSDAQLLSYFNQRGSLQAGKQTDEGLSTTTKIILGVGGAGALYFLYNKFIKSDDV